MIPKLSVSAEEKRERKMLVLMDKPGAERIFPDVEAVKARSRERFAIVRDPMAYREGYPGGRARGGRGRKMK